MNLLRIAARVASRSTVAIWPFDKKKEDAPGGSVPSKSPRPDANAIEEKFNVWQTGRKSPSRKEQSDKMLGLLKDYDEGKGNSAHMKEVYPGWTPEDFDNLISRIEKEEAKMGSGATKPGSPKPEVPWDNERHNRPWSGGGKDDNKVF